MRAGFDHTFPGITLADVSGAALSSPWDFPPKILVIFFRFLGKGGRRADACSGDNVGVVNNIFQSNLADAELLSRGVFRCR